MKKNKVFIACDTTNFNKINKILLQIKNKKLDILLEFGLVFL